MKYKVSVIVAVYNVQEYIDEAMQSIINQTMGFDNIQVIMVDDCSIDESAVVCKKYAELYPENVVFVQKEENSGAADTRNIAMSYVEGELTTAIDPDDYIDLDMFDKVYEYYMAVKDEVDVIAVALRFFEAQKGYHICSQGRFNQTRIIDIDKEWYSIQLNTCGAFVKSEVFLKYQYPKELIVDSEDTYIITQAILEKKKYAVLAGCEYHYRRRQVKNSLTQTNGTKKEWYMDKMRDFYLSLMKQSIERYGEVIRYIQYMSLYLLQWNVKYNVGRTNVLDREETEEYLELLQEVLRYIDDSIIVNQNGEKKLGLNIHAINFLLKVKYGKDPSQYVYKNHNVYKIVGNSLVYQLSDHGINVTAIELKENKLHIRGYYTNPFAGANLQLKAYKNGMECQIIQYSSQTYSPKFFGQIASECMEFSCEFILEDAKSKIYLSLENEFIRYRMPLILKSSPYNKLFPSNAYGYYIENNFLLEMKDKTFIVSKTSKEQHRKKELKLWKELVFGKILLKKRRTNIKAMLLRMLYWCTYPIYHGNWLFMDRADKGGDNAEFLYRYSIKQEDGIRKYFVVNKNSATYRQMRKEHLNVIKQSSLKHRLMFLHCAKFITSQMDVIYMNDMRGIEIFFRDLFKFDYIHIQHGISWQNLDHLLNANVENLKMMTSCANAEHKNLSQSRYGYVNGQLRKGGMARFDGFANREKEKRQIMLCPTWRRELVGRLQVDGIREYNDQFQNSLFFKMYNSLLSDETFIDQIEKLGYTILFALHPNMQAQRNDFRIDARVIFPEKYEIDYDQFLKESQIMITDYSGIQFDFAYMKKPIIYLHHKDLPNHLEESDYFSYEKDAFGDICRDIEQLKTKLIEVIKTGGLMEEKYAQRVEKFFIYNDFNNCKRIYEEIKGA